MRNSLLKVFPFCKPKPPSLLLLMYKDGALQCRSLIKLADLALFHPQPPQDKEVKGRTLVSFSFAFTFSMIYVHLNKSRVETTEYLFIVLIVQWTNFFVYFLFSLQLRPGESSSTTPPPLPPLPSSAARQQQQQQQQRTPPPPALSPGHGRTKSSPSRYTESSHCLCFDFNCFRSACPTLPPSPSTTSSRPPPPGPPPPPSSLTWMETRRARTEVSPQLYFIHNV